MSVNLLKVALKCADVYEFARRQVQWQMPHNGKIVYPVWTSRKPKREEELLDGGSVYWVVKNQIQCRQSILEIVDYQGSEDEKQSYLILCEPKLIKLKPRKKRAFQGWRYLESDLATPDVGVLHIEGEAPPAEMEKDLRAAGLI